MYEEDEDLVVKDYRDASFQTNRDDSVSKSGFTLCLNGGVVSWRSKRQETVVDSAMEADYITASEIVKEVVWIQKIITGLSVDPSITDPLDYYCDNNGFIVEAKNPRSNSRAKHILRR